MTIPAKIARETPKAVLETLACALQVLPDDRTQNIENMRRGLSVSSTQVPANGSQVNVQVNVGTNPAGQDNAPQDQPKKPKKKKSTGKLYGLVAGIVTAFLLAIVIFFILWILGFFEGEDPNTTSSTGNGLQSAINNSSFDTPASSISSVTVSKMELVSFIGRQYTDASTDQNYKDVVKFKIISKEYSDDYLAGQIISQNPKQGEIIENGTTVEVVK